VLHASQLVGHAARLLYYYFCLTPGDANNVKQKCYKETYRDKQSEKLQ